MPQLQMLQISFLSTLYYLFPIMFPSIFCRGCNNFWHLIKYFTLVFQVSLALKLCVSLRFNLIVVTNCCSFRLLLLSCKVLINFRFWIRIPMLFDGGGMFFVSVRSLITSLYERNNALDCNKILRVLLEIYFFFETRCIE